MPPPSFTTLDRLDLSRHLLVVGKTGAGKSSLLQLVLRREFEASRGALLLDPHGDLALDVASKVPRRRKNDVTVFDPTNPQCRGLNPFARLAPDDRPLAVSNLLAAFRKLFGAGWGPRTEHLLRNTFLALTEVRGATLAGAGPILFDEKQRLTALRQVTNAAVRTFWFDEFPAYGKMLAAEAIAAPLNKLGAILGDPRVRAVLTKTRPRLDLGRVMDHGGIVLARLPKGVLGEEAVSVLGAMVLGGVQGATMRRALVAPEDRRPFTLIVDELGAFAPQPILELLAEARKYRVSVVAACQSLAALEHSVRAALLANAGGLVSFRVGGEDAELLFPEFANEYGAVSLTSLSIGEAVVRNGPEPARLVTFPPP